MHLLFNRAALLLSLAGVASASEENPRAREGPPRVHTVFCAECSDNFDYKSLGVYWSHALSGMPGNVTRLLACDEQQLKTYKGLKLGPTFVHKNHGRLSHRRKSDEPAPFGSRPSDGSPSYNKPASIMHWALESEEAKHVDYVLYIDADMLLRRPMDPIQMGVKKGVVVSEHVGYLDVGIKAKLPFEFLPKELAENAGADLDDLTPPGANGKRHASGGWYHFFHMDDIKVIAPRWLHWCEQMRLNPQKYWRMVDPTTGLPGGVDHDIPTGDAYVGHGQAPWISEMYGYVFAASEAGLRHRLTHGVVVYPDEIGGGQPEEPSIIHYGLHCSVGSFHFTKYTHGNFNAVGCNGDLFGDPPKPTHLERLCSETVLTLNDAMCVYYTRSKEEGGCGKTPAEAPTCPKWKEPEQRTCEDKEANCKLWSSSGECAKNSGFMLGSCPRSCGHCDAALQASVPAWSRGLALAKGEIAPPMREMQPSVVAWEEGYPAGQASEEDVYEEISALRNKREKKRPREKAKEEAVARLRGAGLGGGVHPAMMPEGSAPDAFAAAMAAEKRRKVMLMEVERLKGEATEYGAVLGGVEGGREGAGDGGAEDGRRHDRHGAVPHADLERTAAAAASLAVAAEGGHAEGDASLATLKWQMYVGWVAILGLCGALVGRRFCTRRAKPKGKPGHFAARAL